MKKIKIDFLKPAALIAFALIAASFNFINSDKEKDSQFLVRAAEINLEEIQLGKLAQSKSSMVDVKELGKEMENVHAKSMKELVSLAKKKDITIPTLSTFDSKETYKNMEEKSEPNFDKAYCRMMVTGHKKAIELFEKAAKESEDMDIKKWAEDTLPTLRKHLAHSETCQEKCEKMMD